MGPPIHTSLPYQAPENGFRTFLLIWITQSISVIGNALTYFSITIWLTVVMYPNPEQKAQLALALSATGVVWGITHILITPFAGAWADRHDRKMTMITCDLLNGALSLVLMIFIISGSLQLWLLLVIMSLSTVVGDFHLSSFDTSYAMLVPEKQLARANGMMQTSSSISSIMSPALAATLIALPVLARQGAIPDPLGLLLKGVASGTALAIGVDAMTFLIAAAAPLFLSIPSPSHSQQAVRKSYFADIQEGALYIWRRRPMLWLLVTFTMGNLLFSFMSMLRPMIVKFNLAGDWSAQGFTFETALALITSALGFGGVAGGLIISAWGGMKQRRIYGAVFFMLLAAVAQVFFGLSSLLFLAAAASALWSGLVPFMNAHSQAIWQGQTPRELQGRVFAVRRVIVQCTYPIGTALAGAIGGTLNPGAVVAVTGGLLAMFCIAQLFNPYLSKVEDKIYLDALASRASGLPILADVPPAGDAEEA